MRSPLPFLMATLFLDAVGIGLVYPVMPDLIASIGGGAIGGAALWGGVLATVYAAMQFLCAPVLGALSDRFGRRPVLLASLAVMALDYLGSALAPSMGVLVALRVVAGVAAATHATCNAAMADVTAPEDRARAFGLLGAAFLSGFILGPVLGGLLGEIGPRAPFWAAAALAAANLAFGAVALPETVTDATRRPFDLSRANPVGSMRAVAGLRGVGPLLLILFLFDLGYISYVAIWSFWGKAAFGWTPWEIGLSLAAFGVAAAWSQAQGLGLYLRWFGERGTILFGLWTSVLWFVVFALLPPTPLGGWIALLLCPLSSLAEVTVPVLQSRISRLAPPDAQGEAQGVVASVRSAAQVVGPLAMTGVFAWGASVPGGHLLGAPYLLGALLTLPCIHLFRRTPEPPAATA
ncbi:MFS transporter [Rubellimicrobium aerolatum]|uniref:MFS transporter n=1 Tax=Rubellimicrobium aerolatum TaxID=490979 RepID=A0ABW0SH00_9RHOB|nr:MFS transporter [Rubellimicrobium aerolatum]MBP1807306.1 DHA1 family tetracycline resistance protein-like MFS transporter [Rubellimicrobium aerolatum]